MYNERIRPLLDKIGHSEEMHIAAREALHWAEVTPFALKIIERIAHHGPRLHDERLKVTVGELELASPIGVGAGWDKEARAVRGLQALGFDWIEIGGVPENPQPGNDKPRQHALAPGVVTNYLGFNSTGMESVSVNLARYGNVDIPIGVNVAKNKDVPNSEAPEAYARVIDRMFDLASYFTLGVSSPNTANLRELQGEGPLRDIVQASQKVIAEHGGHKPLFIKVAPDMLSDAMDVIIKVAIDNNVTGIIAVNTTINQDIKSKYGQLGDPRLQGGLSGDDEDYRKMANQIVAHTYRESGGRVEIIGAGAIKDGATALERIGAGAKALQIVTAIRGEGPFVAINIKRDLINFMQREGINSLEEIRGSGAAQFRMPRPTGEYYPDFKINPVLSRLLKAEIPPEMRQVFMQLLAVAPTDAIIRAIGEHLGMEEDEFFHD